MTKTICATLTTVLAVLACGPVSAQSLQPRREERPYRGIFAGGVGGSGSTLTTQGSVSGGYDDDILADATQAPTTPDGQAGPLAQFSGQLNYSLTAPRATLNAGLGSSIRHYPTLEDDTVDTYSASVGGTVLVLSKPSLRLHQEVGYQPYTFSAPDAGITANFSEPRSAALVGASSAPEVDYVVGATQYLSYSGGLDVRQQFSRRLSVSAAYFYMKADRLSQEFFTQTGASALHVGMTRDVSLRLGYKWSEGRYEESGTVITSTPDIGLDFLRALSLTRRTRLTFSVGTQATVYQDETRYQLTGNAAVIHEIGRSWQLDGSYQRGTYFVETLSEPVFGDSATLALGGLFTRRLEFQSSASAFLGQATFGSKSDADSYRGRASLTFALTRFANVGIDYAYYRYLMDPSLAVQPGVDPETKRQSIRAHLTLWAPLLNRTRRTDASR